MYKFQEISNFAEAPIVKKRKCTDTICLVVFISFIGVWSFVAITAFKYGNLKAALYPTDSFVSKYLYLNSFYFQIQATYHVDIMNLEPEV